MTDARVAFLFPGQGSQFSGMGREAHDRYAEARDAFAEADEALGFALSELCFEGDESELQRTENTQPAILAVSVALQRVLHARGVEAAFMAGHSLGEYSALVASGALDLGVAVQLVRNRGRYMQEAVAPGDGAMAAILGLDDATVSDVCTRAAADQIVSPANLNSPGQVVVAGHTAAVERAIAGAQEAGARRALMLNVSAPFHCALMQPAADRLAVDLDAIEFRSPAVPVVCNVDAAPLGEPAALRDALVRQVTAPVRWVDDLNWLDAQGATHYVEIGPGKVLSGLLKRTLKGSTGASVQGPDDMDALLASFDD